MEVEITIAPATPAPAAQTVSKKWATIDASFTLIRLTPQTLDFDFLCFLLMMTSLICSPAKRKTVRKATRASVAVGFEPTPTPEEEWLRLHRLSLRSRKWRRTPAGADGQEWGASPTSPPSAEQSSLSHARLWLHRLDFDLKGSGSPFTPGPPGLPQYGGRDGRASIKGGEYDQHHDWSSVEDG